MVTMMSCCTFSKMYALKLISVKVCNKLKVTDKVSNSIRKHLRWKTSTRQKQ